MAYGTQIIIACAIPVVMVIGTVLGTLAFAFVFGKK